MTDQGAVVETQETGARGARRAVLRRQEDGSWMEVAVVTARSEDHAIDQFAKPGSPDVQPGVYKAPLDSQWTGFRGVER